MNGNIASIDPSRHCVHNNVALCALTFKIVVLAWNRSSHQQAREILSFAASDPIHEMVPCSQAKLFTPLVPLPG